MKRILTTMCALAIVITGCASAAEDAGKPCYTPISVEEYPYGSFDEPRIEKTYQLSPSDNPRLIPTEDFERFGRRYYLLDFTREESDAECDMVTYTITFGSKKLPVGVKTLGGTRSKEEAYADPLGQKCMIIVGIVMLALAIAAVIESRMQSHNPAAEDEKDDWFLDLD